MTATATRRRGRPRGNTATSTREQIIASARTVFAERGYAAATLSAIAADAGYTAEMIVYYFGGKAALYLEVTGRELLDVADIARAAMLHDLRTVATDLAQLHEGTP